MTTPSTEPAGLAWEDAGQTVAIAWEDGHQSRFGLPYLRRICPCAACTNAHATGPITAVQNQPPKKAFTILSEAQVRNARAVAEITECYPVGSYAIGFRWKDGHNEGIYSFSLLRAMCPCAACAALRSEEPAS